MAPSVRRPSPPSPESLPLKRLGQTSLQRLRPIPSPPREHQSVKPARAARFARSHHQSCPVEPPLRDQMLGLLPNLRAYALSLTGDPSRADDLVQETILHAWAGIAHFERGTNLAAWLFTILRNNFHTEHRKRRREIEDPDGAYVGRLTVLPGQEAGLEMAELSRALAHLPVGQREALLLVAAEGLSYEDAALILGVAVGTIKSRVNRARHQLADLLQIEDRHEIGPDRVMKAACNDHLIATCK